MNDGAETTAKTAGTGKAKRARGIVYIDVKRCKGCGFCIEYCPKDVLVFSEAFNRKGYHYPELVKTGQCVHCELCEMICPDFAIFSLPEPDETSVDGAAHETAPAEKAV